MNKKITLVTPVKNLIANNRQDYFNRLAYSIDSQQNVEVIHLLVAGNSTDDTKPFIENYASEHTNVKIIYADTKNKWHAMSIGLQSAEGEYILFMEDDSFFAQPDALEIMLQSLEKNDACFTFGPVWIQPDIGNRFLGKVFLHGFYKIQPFALDTMLCDLKFAKEKLKFEDDLSYLGGAGYILRALLSGQKGILLPKPISSISAHTREEKERLPRATEENNQMFELNKRFFLGVAGMTEASLLNAVKTGTVPVEFLNAVTKIAHPFFKETIDKAVYDFQHKFDKFVDYAKAGFRKIYIPLCGMGDAVLFTAVAKKIYEQTGEKLLVGHKNPEIFENNPFVEATDIVSDFPQVLGLKEIEKLNGMGFDIQYATYWLSSSIKNEPKKFFLTYPKEHLIARSYAVCGYSGVIDIKPELYLTDAEKSFGRLVPNDRKQIAIMSSAISPRKQYPYFQQIIDALKDEYDFVQIGAPEDKILNNVKVNMTGKLSVRQTAGILYNSDLFVGEIGGLMHLARAVDCPAVIAYSSTEPAYMARYIANINVGPVKKCVLSQKGIIDKNCDPCMNKNPYCCCRTIPVEKMIKAIHKQIKRGKADLPVEVIKVKADPYKKSINEYLRRYNYVFKLDNL